VQLMKSSSSTLQHFADGTGNYFVQIILKQIWGK